MTTGKRVAFAAIAVLLSFGILLTATVAADMYAHHRVEQSAGVNVWGYRGPKIRRQQPGEHRLFVIGGSTVFGYGVTWDRAFPAQLAVALQGLSKDRAPVSVVNLGYNNQGAYAFRYGLMDYERFGYDAVIFYEGYNDLGDVPNDYIGRRDSPVFRLTGYFPVLPLVMLEKAKAIRSGGNIEAAYWGKTVFRPNLASRATADTLEAAAHIGAGLDDQLGRFAKASRVNGTGVIPRVTNVGCSLPWRFYCGAVYDGIRYALDHGKRVLVVTQPYFSESHRAQQAELRVMLGSRFGGNPAVRYVDFGDLIDLVHSPLSDDRMHLTGEGNALVARSLVAPVVALMPEAFENR
ncbi:MAG: hypothetical protein ACHQO8_12165 [Vicinamibacterales bacterium]